MVLSIKYEIAKFDGKLLGFNIEVSCRGSVIDRKCGLKERTGRKNLQDESEGQYLTFNHDVSVHSDAIRTHFTESLMSRITSLMNLATLVVEASGPFEITRVYWTEGTVNSRSFTKRLMPTAMLSATCKFEWINSKFRIFCI